MKIETLETAGFSPAFKGMRNPYDSWAKSDSKIDPFSDELMIGQADHGLALRLIHAGPEHAKFLRQIVVWADVTAPLYWWKEADTYRLGAEKNSCSTMHSVHKQAFGYENFQGGEDDKAELDGVIHTLNDLRSEYLNSKDKAVWLKIIHLLPNSYMQTRTCMFSYAALANICRQRKGHKLQEWATFIDWCRTLPESWLIFGGDAE